MLMSTEAVQYSAYQLLARLFTFDMFDFSLCLICMAIYGIG